MVRGYRLQKPTACVHHVRAPRQGSNSSTCPLLWRGAEIRAKCCSVQSQTHRSTRQTPLPQTQCRAASGISAMSCAKSPPHQKILTLLDDCCVILSTTASKIKRKRTDGRKTDRQARGQNISVFFERRTGHHEERLFPVDPVCVWECLCCWLHPSNSCSWGKLGGGLAGSAACGPALADTGSINED